MKRDKFEALTELDAKEVLQESYQALLDDLIKETRLTTKTRKRLSSLEKKTTHPTELKEKQI